MDVEGIYRKAGGSILVTSMERGFDGSDDYDISDPAMDIMAVACVLKNYLRKLPTPLITFDAYDAVLDAHGKFFFGCCCRRQLPLPLYPSAPSPSALPAPPPGWRG